MAPWRRTGRRALRALFAALAVLTLLVGALRANARYFYCPLMDAVASRACCAPDHAHDGSDASDAPSVEAPECCEVHHVGSLPTASGAEPVRVAASPLAAILSPPLLVAPPSRLAVRDARLFARHRGPPSPGEARARTMVFLI